MKHMQTLMILFTMAILGTVMAADVGSQSHRVVIELTSEGSKQYEAVLNNVQNVINALGKGTEVLVVTHGPAIGFVQKVNQKFAERMEKLSKEGAVFVACENTMKRKQITKDQLLPFVKTVDSGVAEVVRRQEAGWAYVKGGH
jgi:intracellular sulfur oxidation DsrE/DsrF family protein